MNAPPIPKPRGKWSDNADELIRQAYGQLLRGHKKQAVRAVETLRRRVDALYLEVMQDDAQRQFFRPKVRLIAKHPSWLPDKRVDKLNRI